MGKNMEPLGSPGDSPEQIAQNVAAQKARAEDIHRFDTMAKDAMDAGNYSGAEASARQSVSLGVSSGRGLELLAAALDAQGKSHEALQTYKKISDMSIFFSSTELPYALLLLKSGQWAQAVVEYNKQLPHSSDADLMQAYYAFSPTKPDPVTLAAAIHIGLGLTYSWRGYHGSAIERSQQSLDHFEQAAALSPNSLTFPPKTVPFAK